MKNINQLKEVFLGLNSESCPSTINFHCHTTFSDGSMTPEILIKQAKQLELSHLAVTDHHSVKAYPIMKEWLIKNQQSQIILPKLWTGIEITCILHKCLVHVLGFGFDNDHPSMRIYSQGNSVIGDDLQASSVVKSIHKAGGLAFLAHPARYRIDFRLLLEEAFKIEFDGAEVWYDYNYSKNWQPTPFICESINKLVNEYGKLSCCGTDTHGFSLKGR
tara:strand:- start:71 stop:724 length:654 start_codon:yes stop_codon:yes gene_type:complete